MRTLLLAVAVALAACGGQQVRGVDVIYEGGTEPYGDRQVERLLDAVQLIYWHEIDWQGMRVHLWEAPECAADSDLVHQLAHQLRQRYDNEADWDHQDWRYFAGHGTSAISHFAALVPRAQAWFVQVYCAG